MGAMDGPEAKAAVEALIAQEVNFAAEQAAAEKTVPGAKVAAEAEGNVDTDAKAKKAALEGHDMLASPRPAQNSSSKHLMPGVTSARPRSKSPSRLDVAIARAGKVLATVDVAIARAGNARVSGGKVAIPQ